MVFFTYFKELINVSKGHLKKKIEFKFLFIFQLILNQKTILNNYHCPKV